MIIIATKLFRFINFVVDCEVSLELQFKYILEENLLFFVATHLDVTK